MERRRLTAVAILPGPKQSALASHRHVNRRSTKQPPGRRRDVRDICPKPINSLESWVKFF